MRVRAIARGVYDNILYEPDQEHGKSEFVLHPTKGPLLDKDTRRQVVKDGVPQMRDVSVDEQFAPEWMQKIPDVAPVDSNAAAKQAAKSGKAGGPIMGASPARPGDDPRSVQSTSGPLAGADPRRPGDGVETADSTTPPIAPPRRPEEAPPTIKGPAPAQQAPEKHTEPKGPPTPGKK